GAGGEFYAHGGAAGGAGALGVDADDLAELADDHHVRGVVDEVDAGDLADFAGGLHVDDALAAAGLEAVGVDVGALAVAVVGDGEDEALIGRRFKHWDGHLPKQDSESKG